MMDVLDNPGVLIPMFAMLVPISIVAIAGYFQHKKIGLLHQERLAAIAKGLLPDLVPDPDKRVERPKTMEDYLRRGLLWLCPGAGLVAFVVLVRFDVPSDVRMLAGVVGVIFGGLGVAYLAYYFIETQKRY